MRYAQATIEKMDAARAAGFEIIVGNDWRLARRPKWAGFEVWRIAQTNSRVHGHPVRVIWAIRPK